MPQTTASLTVNCETSHESRPGGHYSSHVHINTDLWSSQLTHNVDLTELWICGAPSDSGPVGLRRHLWKPFKRVIEDKSLHLTCINVCMLERQWPSPLKCLKEKKEEKKNREKHQLHDMSTESVFFSDVYMTNDNPVTKSRHTAAGSNVAVWAKE